MRSRYSAFVLGLPGYLQATWHATTRPAELELDEDMQWLGLEILKTRAGGPSAVRGVVQFAAYYAGPRGEEAQEETSSFVREDGAWFYVDAL